MNSKQKKHDVAISPQLFGGLYVHVPFCRGKCDYCAFYSLPACTEDDAKRFMDQLTLQLISAAEQLAEIRTIFIGGGTPTALPSEQLDRLTTAVRTACGNHTDGVEWTVEINPATCSTRQLEQLIEAGVNRFSFGIQSFNQDFLRRLGRRPPPPGHLGELLKTLARNDLHNFSMDLIYGIPGQSLKQWTDDIKKACDSGINHLSTYELTWEEGTKLRPGKAPHDEDETLDMWQRTTDVAGTWGMRRYEVSNLAKPGCECRHNNDCWHGAAYLGLGPAAASFDGSIRWTEPGEFKTWLDGRTPEIDDIPRDRRLTEVFIFGLRTVDGWRPGEFKRRTGAPPPKPCIDHCRNLAEQAFLVGTDDAWRPTDKGLRFADFVAECLLG